jgi:nanoRNase/pAp phosphatase (c-di-AMP/oligoRNAs hydrolase)
MEKKKSDKSKLPQTKGPAETSFAQILSGHEGETHLIVLHDFPDPDTIAAACAHRLLSDKFKIKTDIIYAERISHPQNIALVNLLKIPLLKYEGELPQAYDAAVFVDNQGTTCPEIVAALAEANVPTLMVVDHHELQDALAPLFKDVRPVGATATIYAEYLSQNLEMNKENEAHVMVATALMHGLVSDTSGFLRAKKADFEAAAFLSQYADSELLAQILGQARSRKVMETIHKALGNRVLVENYSIVGIGYLQAKDRDAIPQAADFLLSEANVHTVIIYGIVITKDQTESLVGSMRTTEITISPDEFIKEVLGKNENGRFYGGGKTSAGGFEIPIGFLSGADDDAYRRLKWQVYDQQIKHKIFNKIGVEMETDEAVQPDD